MDLVDIDQVLDNLELSVAADELSCNIAAAAVKLPPTPKATVSLIESSTSKNLSDNPTQGRSNTKSFVGVSQVFNSLDDYSNDIKELETATIQQYVWQQRDDPNDDDLGIARTTSEIASLHEDDIDDFNASSDIQKYTEGHGDSSEAAVFSSDSLTTSSCSTFSSGPSPANATQTEDAETNSVARIETDDEEIADGDGDHDFKGNEVPVEAFNETFKLRRRHSLPEAILEKINKDQMLDDIAVGVSSLSITTTTESQSIMPCEVTASSALGKVLNELTTTVDMTPNDSPQEEHRTEELEECVNYGQPAAEAVATNVQEAIKADAVACKQDFAQPTAPFVPKQMQPITFCSTMDEISDTELDSMLQEIDIDDVVESNVNNKLCNEQTFNQATNTNDDSIEVASEQDTSQSADNINGDNFSQASTVEFADIKAQATAISVEEEGEEVVDAIASQSTAPDGVDVDVEEAIAEQYQEQEAASSYTSSESDSLSGRKIDTTEECDVNAIQRPERPKTLDLATVNTQNYNAGQTPPNGIVEPNVNNLGVASQGVVTGAEESNNIAEAVGYSDPHANLGKVPPIWVPDNMATGCMQCQQKFNLIKRRHHCRACGKVLCSVCCSQRYKLEFLTEPESRVCVPCFLILTDRQEEGQQSNLNGTLEHEAHIQVLPPTPMRSPNPNNPMEYCSTIPPHRQVSTAVGAPPPSVIVPVGVLKKDGSYSSNSSNSSGNKNRKRKSVMFSDGIAPGSELASSMEAQWGEAKQPRRGERNRSTANNKPPTPGQNEARNIENTTMGLVAQLFRGSIPPGAAASAIAVAQSACEQNARAAGQNSPLRKTESKRSKKLPPIGVEGCYIPNKENALPPICIASREDTICDFEFKEVQNDYSLIERLQRETLRFFVRNNFYVLVKIVSLNCCMNRTVINFTTSGLHNVGNDEIVILLDFKSPESRDDMTEPGVPQDIFTHLNEIYCEAEHGRPISELAFTSPKSSSFLGSREYGGFIYIRATYQCLQEVILPESPYMIGVLIHRHEVPWAKVFPLRLMLRLGAQYRYYPCPLISIRNRESVYAEIAQTIINFLADFRNYSYTLPAIRGMFIHMEDRQTTVLIPRNRLDDINKAINNASDHILAFAGNFSKIADGHLVCMQNVNDDHAEPFAYSTQAINIQGQPRKVTGASFFVLNESLKSTSGLSGKCSIVEDGLMVQIMPDKMEEVRNALRNQKDIDIICGPVDANEQQTEVVSIKWVENDKDFNLGVKSPIDDRSMEGVKSMRVHASFNYSNTNYLIRLTDIYIIKYDDWYAATMSTFAASSADITRISEQIARSASMALLPFLDLLISAGINKLAIRATLDQENVCYEAGARGAKLAPLYMNALDNHLISTLHSESSGIDDAIILELVFYILNV